METGSGMAEEGYIGTRKRHLITHSGVQLMADLDGERVFKVLDCNYFDQDTSSLAHDT